MSIFDEDLAIKSLCLGDVYKIIKYTSIDNRLYERDPLIMNFDESSIRHHLLDLWRSLDSTLQKRMSEDIDELINQCHYVLYVFFMMFCMYSDPDELSDVLTHNLTRLRKREGAKVEVTIEHNYEGSEYTKVSVKILSVYSKTIVFVLEYR